MALLGTKPKPRKRLSCSIYGEAGCGKTTAAAQFPSPYIIDCESGTNHYGDLIAGNGGVVLHTTDIDLVNSQVAELARGGHQYRTLVIDPFNVLWDVVYETGTELKGDESFGRDKNWAKRKMRHLMRMLHEIDLNVVLTCHAAPLWRQGDQVGIKPDGYEKVMYDVDVVFELRQVGHRRLCRITKTRLKSLHDMQKKEFEWSYDAIADAIGPHLNDDAEDSGLATKESADRLHDLYDKLEGGADRRAKFLSSNEANNLRDVPQVKVDAAIAGLRKHLGLDTEDTTDGD